MPSRILHVGAHLGEERVAYLNEGWAQSGITWVEAQPDLAKKLSSDLSHTTDTVINATVWSNNDEVRDFHLMNNSESSSLFKLGTHLDIYPEITEVSTYSTITKRLDSLLAADSDFDFVNLDIQGAELAALIGLGDLIANIRWIYVEVNRAQVYKGAASIEELDLFLKSKNFVRVDTYWMRNAGWGDALYIRTKVGLGLSLKIVCARALQITQRLLASSHRRISKG